MEDVVTGIKRQLENEYGGLLLKWYEVVDWKEPFIVSLISFHLLFLLVVVYTRKQYVAQCVWFALLIALIGLSERINTFGRDHWRSFASQRYFDERGFFMLLFFSGPLLCLGFVQLMLNIHTMVYLLIRLKRLEHEKKLN